MGNQNSYRDENDDELLDWFDLLMEEFYDSDFSDDSEDYNSEDDSHNESAYITDSDNWMYDTESTVDDWEDWF